MMQFSYKQNIHQNYYKIWEVYSRAIPRHACTYDLAAV